MRTPLVNIAWSRAATASAGQTGFPSSQKSVLPLVANSMYFSPLLCSPASAIAALLMAASAGVSVLELKGVTGPRLSYLIWIAAAFDAPKGTAL